VTGNIEEYKEAEELVTVYWMKHWIFTTDYYMLQRQLQYEVGTSGTVRQKFKDHDENAWHKNDKNV